MNALAEYHWRFKCKDGNGDRVWRPVLFRECLRNDRNFLTPKGNNLKVYF